MRRSVDERLRGFSRAMRKDATNAERRMWSKLRDGRQRPSPLVTPLVGGLLGEGGDPKFPALPCRPVVSSFVLCMTKNNHASAGR